MKQNFLFFTLKYILCTQKFQYFRILSTKVSAIKNLKQKCMDSVFFLYLYHHSFLMQFFKFFLTNCLRRRQQETCIATFALLAWPTD